MRFSETDALGVVYYGQYYTYFDVARQELLRSLGIVPALLSRKGLDFAAESSCRYHASARFDDFLTLGVEIARIGDNSITYTHTIKKGNTRIAEGRVIDVMVDRAGRSTKISPEIRRKLSRRPA